MKRWVFIFVLAALPSAADPFINLTFDDPDLSGPLTPIYPGGPLRGNADQLLRGWRATADGVAVPTMTYSLYPIGSGGGPFNLMQNPPDISSSAFGANQLWLFSSFPFPPELRLKQVGVVPSNATGLSIGSSGYIQAIINGQQIGEVDPAAGGPSIMNVAPFAGQTVELEFVLPATGSTRFDIFGWVVVPEPATWALLGLGLTALGWQYKRRR